MKKELQALDIDIEDAETARSVWEEWRTNVGILMLKLSNDIQYVLNAKGSTPAEVMGIDCKPTLESFADEINRSSVEKLEELISLQQQSSELAAKIEGKRTRL
ncbi:hypothetical protein Ddye_003229 [Dipteronia dyeriana]|uniref:Uncharacterized protein n=1 Tax=Dipteronia dyeriana TaxID=168575 RepID=A0AAD9XSM2_9ROSI|nr:hypothetical protein Ddye_003229 [Dipteronia dyeriana]